MQTGDASLIWEGHKVGRDIGYCHLEKLHHLEALPATGFMVSCFPVKIKGAFAGWTRAVALWNKYNVATFHVYRRAVYFQLHPVCHNESTVVLCLGHQQ